MKDIIQSMTKKQVEKAPEKEVPPKEGVADKSKKIRKMELPIDNFTIKDIAFPEKLLDKTHKKYATTIRWLEKEGEKFRKRSKYVRFGLKESKDFIDHKDKLERYKLISRMRNYESPFKGNFYRLHLLNNAEHDSIEGAYISLINNLGLNKKET